ncbi:hypothetical protein C0581_00700 [Candidatus Parcubacteria bacterium]|nr:MAG: hypothetical protein C0581_00700 [Candidatus Parcubacteria bacterium]
MTTHPPHLPHKSCSVTMRTLWSNIRNVIFFIFVSILAGVTGALITSAWIEPTFYPNQNLYFVDRTPQLYGANQRPDVSVAQRFNASTLRLFDKTQVVNEGMYPESSYIGQVVMLSSNGWGVTYMPDFNLSYSTRFDAVSNHGAHYEIEKSLFDAKTGFVYLKFVGNDFRVMSFPEWDVFNSGSEVWSVHDTEWKFRIVGDRDVMSNPPFVSDRDVSSFHIEPGFSQEGVVLTSQGQLLGFVDTQDVLHSAWSVEHHMPMVLGSGQLDDFVSTWMGYMVYNNDMNPSGDEPREGFYITSAGNRPRGLRIGDLLLQINGKKVSEHSLSRAILSAPEEFVVSVWRKGEEFDIIVTK